MWWNMEYEWCHFWLKNNKRVPTAEASTSDSCLCLSVSVIFSVCFCTHVCVMAKRRGMHRKTSCWIAAQLFGQPMDSAHQLRQDKRVFILAIAAVLSALPLHILVVFSDKAGESTAGLRGLQRRGKRRQAGSKKKIGGDLSGGTEKCWWCGWLFVCLSVRRWTFADVVLFSRFKLVL